MTIKKIFALALCFTTTWASAAPRTAQQALLVAKQFALQTPAFQRVGQGFQTVLSSFNAAPMTRTLGVKSVNPAYYVVNIGDDNGFVVVSGDDIFKPVLGYTTEGHLSQGDILPDGLQYWLGFLSEEMQSALASRTYEEVCPSARNSVDVRMSDAPDTYTQSVEPLLTTKWNQTSPYNNKTPNYATGCVATGTAQVMKYWNYPAMGRGSHTNGYFPTYSADFGATTYDWANMKDVYGGKYDTKAEVDAVSTLMYHLGVATDMRWSKDNSGTPNMFAAYALVNFFGYNKNLYAEGRDYVSLGAWKALILQQLYSGHPLCYAGMTSSSSGAGHFFVLDGYDAATGTFHFNWGWGGAYDGYFDITALNPGGAGQAGALSGSYNYYQQMFINVQPSEVGEYVAHFDADAVTPAKAECPKGSVVMRALHLSNNALSFQGTIGMALYNADGTLYRYVASPQSFPGNLNIGSSYSDAHEVPVSLEDIADGTYTACVAVQHKDYMDTPYPVRAFYGKPTYYTLTISDGTASFAEQKMDVELTDVAQPVIVNANVANTLYQNVVSCFQVTLKNTSNAVFCDEVGVCIQQGNRDKNRQYITSPCTLLPGEEKTIDLVGKVLRDPGSYKLIPCYGENGEYIVLNQALEINIEEAPVGIHSTTEVTADQPIYNIQGVRTGSGQSLPKGLYITRGKKFIVK